MASKSSSATKKRTKKLQTFKDDYTAKWKCIISSKKSVNHARCTVCAYDFATGHGGANDVLYGLITLSNWKKALSTDEHTCTGRKILKISANAHARENCTCNFSIAQKITDFVSKLLILSFIMPPPRRAPEALCFRVVRPSVRPYENLVNTKSQEPLGGFSSYLAQGCTMMSRWTD